eukprot:CAMPEP_0184688056 /NCGR_PEP_ID=MMETSP0312-20130426/28409_1 /TAXON_ID=31354 /ORGANISM="Compsopogon coeruleus, Strain SAG 36.94" /LENGTH=81 /DNA_ID=CAMNT_0027144787 /DNA_START=128 /DNA_END=370 /DNA_ORIENTATION=-
MASFPTVFSKVAPTSEHCGKFFRFSGSSIISSGLSGSDDILMTPVSLASVSTSPLGEDRICSSMSSIGDGVQRLPSDDGDS